MTLAARRVTFMSKAILLASFNTSYDENKSPTHTPGRASILAMKKHVFLFFLAFGLLTPCIAAGQHATKIARVGYLGQSSQSKPDSPQVKAFSQKLRDLGWVDGKNLIMEWRFALGNEYKIPEFVKELIGLKVDVIVATGEQPVRVAQKSTKTIPIVMTNPNDPVASGFVESLSHPGGNITGPAALGNKLDGKRLQLLKEMIPKLSFVVNLVQFGRVMARIESKVTEQTANALGVKLHPYEVRAPDDFEHALKNIPPGMTAGVLVTHSQVMNSNRFQLAEVLAKRGMPAIYGDRRYAESGGLMSYGPNIPDLFARSAVCVDKILRGANPSELPVELPTKFELVVNLQAAQAIRFPIPDSFLRWADEVIK